jgi:hypothetical protein
MDHLGDPPDAAGSEGGSSRLWDGAVVVLLGLVAVLCLTSMRFNSPTSDEQNHISRGYHYLVTGSLDLNIAPPFVNALSGVPLLLHEGIIIPQYDTSHRKTYINQFAEEFVWVYNDAQTVIYAGRAMTVLLSMVLGYFVFRWAKGMWGMQGGLLALFLYVLDPNILAHSQLVTTDLGVTCLIFVSTYFLWRFLTRRRNADLALAGLLLGLALATKLSALLLVPVFALIGIIEAVLVCDVRLPGRWPWKAQWSQRRWQKRVYFLCAVAIVLAVYCFLSLWASYRFEVAPLTTDTHHATVDRLVQSPALRRLAYRVVESVWVPFPTYFSGIRWLQRYAQRGAPAFLMGQHSQKGWWYYFLVAFAIKTPLPALILMAAAVLLALRGHLTTEKKEYVVLVPVAVFFVATLFSFLSIGYRHILPVLPFLFVLVGRLASCVRRRWVYVALIVLCAWYAAGSFRIHPHYLAYFNEIVGGPDNGYKYLVDSNLDWGQDLGNLAGYMSRNGIEEISLAYFGSANPAYYGIRAQPLPTEEPGDLQKRPSAVYAISATYLQGGYLGDTEAFSWLRRHEPFAKVGYSIFLYHLP